MSASNVELQELRGCIDGLRERVEALEARVEAENEDTEGDESADAYGSDVDHESRLRELTHRDNVIEEDGIEDKVYHVSHQGEGLMARTEIQRIRESDDYELFSMNPERVRVVYIGD